MTAVHGPQVAELARWLRGPLKARLEAACRGERLADTGRFDMDRLSGMVDEHLAGSRDFSAPLWSVLMFDAFLANAGKPEAPAESAMGQVP